MSSLEERVAMFNETNRSLAFILMSAAVYGGIFYVGASESLRHLLNVPFVPLCWACALSFGMIFVASTIYYRAGHLSRWYVWTDKIETWTIATSLIVLIHLSAGNPIFWAFYAGYFLILAQSPSHHFTLGAISIAHLIPSLTSFWIDGLLWQASTTAVIEGVGLLLACDGALRERRLARAEAETLEWRRLLEFERLREERTRISRELHDGMAGQLSALTARIALLQLEDDAPSEPKLSRLSSELSDLRDLSQRSSNDLRSIVWAYGQPDRRASEALAYFHQRCAEICPEDVLLHFQSSVRDSWLAGNSCLQLLRIVQEAVWNSLRHGAARRLILRAADSDDGLVIELEDDGRDQLAPTPHSSGSGLSNMQRRAHALGGSVHVRKNHERPGFTVTIVVPQADTRAAIG